LDTLYPHLYPEDGSAVEEQSKKFAARMAAARMAGMVSLNSDVDKEEEEKKKKKQKEKEEAEEVDQNQKFGLVCGLLQVGDFANADLLLARLAPLHPGQDKQVVDALCEAVETMIEPLYRETPLGKLALSVPTPKADVSSAVTLGSYDELESRLFPLLQHLRGRIAHRPTLFAKLCRLLTDYANKVQQEPDKLNQLLPVVSLVLLPALSWFSSNPCAYELWTLVKIWPYEERFKAYVNSKHTVL